jgi:hypothetical protein
VLSSVPSAESPHANRKCEEDKRDETSFEFEILVTSSFQSLNLSQLCKMTRLVTQKMRYPVIVHTTGRSSLLLHWWLLQLRLLELAHSFGLLTKRRIHWLDGIQPPSFTLFAKGRHSFFHSKISLAFENHGQVCLRSTIHCTCVCCQKVDER